jgi:putative aldouronate transport system permease protein
MVRQGLGDRIFDVIVHILLAVIGLLALIPILAVFSASITPYSEVLKHGGIVLFPNKITLEAYGQLWNYPRMLDAFKVTVYITVIGTLLNLLLTSLMAYPLSRLYLPGRKVIMSILVITMYFYPGIIPRYWIVKTTGLINSLWAMIIPSLISTFNLMILVSYLQTLPNELFESARIDGAGEFRILWEIALPLTKPAIMVVGLLFAVGQWNSYLQPLFYVPNRDLWPLQPVIREILRATDALEPDPTITIPTVTMQMATIVFSSVPILLVYPFIQRHFTKGLLLGAIKG